MQYNRTNITKAKPEELLEIVKKAQDPDILLVVMQSKNINANILLSVINNDNADQDVLRKVVTVKDLNGNFIATNDEVFKAILNQNNINNNEYIDFVFFLAAMKGNLDLVRDILEIYGKDANSRKKLFIDKVFQNASGYGRLDFIKYILEKYVKDDNSRDEFNFAEAIKCAANYGQIDVIKYILENYGKNCNVIQEFFLDRACVAAAGAGQLEVVKYFLEKYVAEKASALKLVVVHAFGNAANNGKLNVVKYLLEIYGKDEESRKALNIVRALEDAAAFGQLDVVRYIIETYGKSNESRKALFINGAFMEAVIKGECAVVKYIVEKMGKDKKTREELSIDYAIKKAFEFYKIYRNGRSVDKVKKIFDVIKYFMLNVIPGNQRLRDYIFSENCIQEIRSYNEIDNLFKQLNYIEPLQKNKHLQESIHKKSIEQQNLNIKICDFGELGEGMLENLDGNSTKKDNYNSRHIEQNGVDVWSLGIDFYNILNKDFLTGDIDNYANDFKPGHNLTVINNSVEFNQIFEDILKFRQVPKFIMLGDSVDFGKVGCAGLMISQENFGRQFLIKYINENNTIPDKVKQIVQNFIPRYNIQIQLVKTPEPEEVKTQNLGDKMV